MVTATDNNPPRTIGNTEILASAYARRLRAILNGAPGEIPEWLAKADPNKEARERVHWERLAHPCADTFPVHAEAYRLRHIERWSWNRIGEAIGKSARRAFAMAEKFENKVR